MKISSRDFPGGPVVKTPHFQCRGYALIPGWGTKVPHAAWCNQKNKNKLKNFKQIKLIVKSLCVFKYFLYI